MKSFKDVNKQLNKEALCTIALFILFFIWWYVCAYSLADATWTVFGLPAWFFMSCVVGWVLCCVGVVFLIKLFFKDVDLDAYQNDTETEQKKGGEIE